MTVTVRWGSAGQGVDYLERTVVSDDREVKARDLDAYWSTGGDTPGQWIGTQAAAWGIAETMVTKDAADALYKDGAHPITGQRLGRAWPRYPTVEERYEQLLAAEPDASEARREELQRQAERAGNQTARSFAEQVYSPVKSWSVLWAMSDEKGRRQLEDLEKRVFLKVFNRAEQEACWTRIGSGGSAQVRAKGFIAATYVHRTSRTGDPDFHRHVAISAKVQAEDGRWLALDGRPLMRMTVMLSELYTTELERAMADEMGILAAPREDTIRPEKRPVREYLGVDLQAIKLFSQRRQMTEKALNELVSEFIQREGRKPTRAESYALAQAATLAVRPAKKKAKSIGAERREWRRQAWKAGYKRPSQWVKWAQRASREAAAQQGELTPLPDVAARVLQVLEGQRESWTRANAESEVLRQLTASGWHIQAGAGFDSLVSTMTDHVLDPERCELISPPEAVRAPSPFRRPDGSSIFVQTGAERYTSHRIKAWERDLGEAKTRPCSVVQLTPEQIDTALANGDIQRGFVPSDEQRLAVHEVFLRDTRVTDIIGPAGTGKTTIMRLVKEVADAHGIEILGLAGGQLQADNLGEAAGIRAENVARWLTMSTKYGRGQARWTLSPNTIVIVDEAGQASTPDLHQLLQQVEDAGGRLLPVGDPRQLGSPGVGGALAYLESLGESVYLSEVRRFRSSKGALRTWEIDAAKALAHGDADGSWEAYNSRGRIHVGSLDEMLHAAYAAWQQDMSDGLSSILIAPTNQLAAQLSSWARADRVAAGIVDDRSTIMLRDSNLVGAGDQIVTRRNNRDLRCSDTRQYVRNGDVWTVLETRDGELLVEHVITHNRLWLPHDYVAEGGVELGYAITKDRAQGVNVSTGHGLLVDGMDSNSAYPEMTRGTLANHGYVATEPQIDPETGEPGAPKSGRQVWAGIVSRDGTQLSATALQGQLSDDAQAIRTHVPILRYTLESIADSQAQEAVRRLLPHVGEAIVTAPAWPALRAQLLELAEEGIDTDALIVQADRMREWHDPIDDYAAILHGRNRLVLRTAGRNRSLADKLSLADDAPQPTTAATYESDPRADADDVLAAMGLSLPDTNGTNGGDERHAFAYATASQIVNRVTHLADRAKAGASDREGWAAAFGPEPEDLAEAAAWHARIQAAAAYRDLADYTGSDATGPAPTTDEPMQRALWRAAQTVPDDAEASVEAAAALRSGATWMDAIGTPPPAGDPTREAWVRAVSAVATYRDLWEHGSESAAIGARPDEPVQAVDYDAAERALSAYRLVRQHPNLARATEGTLALILTRGEAGAQAAAEATTALAVYHRADIANTAAMQEAEDAANRAAEAASAAADLDPGDRDDARLAELDRAADRAAVAAMDAQRAADEARATVERTAPGAVKAREDAQRAEQARKILARRALHRPTEEPSAPGPDGPTPWRDRAYGDMSDTELITIAASAVEEAARIEEAQRARTATVTRPNEQATPEELRALAAQVRAESRTRALMDVEQRTSEADERQAHRARRATERLEQAYANPGREGRRPETQPAPEGTGLEKLVADRRRDRRAEDPARPPRNRAERRLTQVDADRPTPESTEAAKRRRAPNRPAADHRSPETTAPSLSAEQQARAEQIRDESRRRTRAQKAAERLDAAHGDRDPRTGKPLDPNQQRRRRPRPDDPGRRGPGAPRI